MATLKAAASAVKAKPVLSPRIKLFEALKAQNEPLTFNRFHAAVKSDPLFASRARVRNLLHELKQQKLVSVICPPGVFFR